MGTGPSTLTMTLLPRHLGFLDGIVKTLETVLAFGFHHVGDPGVHLLTTNIKMLGLGTSPS